MLEIVGEALGMIAIAFLIGGFIWLIFCLVEKIVSKFIKECSGANILTTLAISMFLIMVIVVSFAQ